MEISTSQPSAQGQRIDRRVDAGESYYVRLSGTHSDVDLRLTNLVHQAGTKVSVYGTEKRDLFEFTASDTPVVTINGVTYGFSDTDANVVRFYAGKGDDEAILRGTSAAETAKLWPRTATLKGSCFTAVAEDVESITVDGGEGEDFAVFYDSTGYDTFSGGPSSPHHARLSGATAGESYVNVAKGFPRVCAYASLGRDTAELYDSETSLDVYVGTPASSILYGADFYC